MISFTGTISYKMVKAAPDEIDSKRTDVVHCHTGSKDALTKILAEKEYSQGERVLTI